ncbi:MAG: nicotinamide-nucleotide adenylyltransferase [Nanoarchaeota archaeon]|nr:nicotinamide-nucleotide adenylyltransferase [Nanoarchaeota archaeon]
MKTGLFIGRFQPFHNGHLSVIKQMEKKCDEIIIAIGSSQYGFYKENPMTAGERIAAISAVLRKELKLPFYLILVEDIHCYPKYVSHVKSLVPRFNVVYNTDNGVIEELFREAGYEVRQFEQRIKTRATDVRNLIAKGKEWKHLVPENVFSFLVKNKIDERIRRLMNNGN